jgi:hypothetical protein
MRISCRHLHFTAGRELRARVDQGRLHVISGIAHGGGTVRQSRLFKALKASIQQARNNWLCLTTQDHLRSGRGSDSARRRAFVLTGRHTPNAYQSGQTEAQNKDTCIHCSLPANAC